MTTKERAIEAAKNVSYYNENFPDLIKESISKTQVYRKNSSFISLVEPLKKKVENSISFQIIKNYNAPIESLRKIFSIPSYKNKRIAILNAGDYKNAGGRFLKGGTSQECLLCQNSFLYNVLSSFNKEYYVVNQRKLNKSLYAHTALYTPDINFFLSEKENNLLRTNIDVITYSPPNMDAFYAKNIAVVDRYNLLPTILKERFNFIKNICELNNIEILIINGLNYKPLVAYKTIRQEFQLSSTIETIIYTPNNFFEYQLIEDLRKISIFNYKIFYEEF